jgi:hypothetical protein
MDVLCKIIIKTSKSRIKEVFLHYYRFQVAVPELVKLVKDLFIDC